MRRHTLFSVLAAGVLGAAVLAPAAVSAKPVPKATGGVEFTGPQAMSFNAFDHGDTGDRGTVSYTNFNHSDPGSGVWRLRESATLTFVEGGDYNHVFDSLAMDVTSPTSYDFSGSGHYVSDPGYTWDIVGSVDGDMISYVMTYTGKQAGYVLTASGSFAADGSASGTSSDTLGRSLPWSMSAGSGWEVLHYTADVTCAEVDSSNDTASFAYTIPAGSDVSGIYVIWSVSDGGSPAVGNDWAGYTTGGSGCAYTPGAGTQTLTGGNLVVH